MLSREERRAREIARTFDGLPFSGMGGDDAAGMHFDIDPDEWIYGKLTEQPDGSHPGYSWVEQYPAALGTFVDPPANQGLSGDNGVTSGSPANPAFEVSGRTDLTVGTIVKLVRGFQHPDSDTPPLSQEWLFIVGSPGSTNTKMIRISDGFYDDGFWKYWPGVIQEQFVTGSPSPWVDTASTQLTPAGGIRAGGQPVNCLLVDWYDYGSLTLGFDGTSGVIGRDEGETFDPDGVFGGALPIYSTDHYRSVIVVDCAPDGMGGQKVSYQLGG